MFNISPVVVVRTLNTSTIGFSRVLSLNMMSKLGLDNSFSVYVHGLALFGVLLLRYYELALIMHRFIYMFALIYLHLCTKMFKMSRRRS